MDIENIGRLLSLISHEVRAPVGVMRGYLRLLEQRGPELSDQQRHAVSAALKAGERAAELLAQVSLLAQLARQETPFAFQPTALVEILGAATEGIALPEDQSRGAKVTLDLGPVTPREIRADWDLLRRALAALISAVVRAQAADVHVTISARDDIRHDIPGVAIHIAAADTADATPQPLNETRGGLGLDLPMAAALVTAHRGEVHECRSGTQLVGVVVWLPLAE
jgi:signal transduction histidine kinase